MCLKCSDNTPDPNAQGIGWKVFCTDKQGYLTSVFRDIYTARPTNTWLTATVKPILAGHLSGWAGHLSGWAGYLSGWHIFDNELDAKLYAAESSFLTVYKVKWKKKLAQGIEKIIGPSDMSYCVPCTVAEEMMILEGTQ